MVAFVTLLTAYPFFLHVPFLHAAARHAFENFIIFVQYSIFSFLLFLFETSDFSKGGKPFRIAYLALRKVVP